MPQPLPAPPRRPLADIAALHGIILDRLGPEPLAEDQLIRDLTLPAAQVSPELIALELDGRILRQPGGLFPHHVTRAHIRAPHRAVPQRHPPARSSVSRPPARDPQRDRIVGRRRGPMRLSPASCDPRPIPRPIALSRGTLADPTILPSASRQPIQDLRAAWTEN